LPTSWIELITGPIDAGQVRGFVTGDPGLGGIVFFEGVTRGETDPQHGCLVRLEYEAHPSMARREMERLAAEVSRRFGTERVVIVHRTGSVPPGETSVLIAVACGHRAEAFDACRWIIDTLKKDVPIWKKDVFEDGFVRWVDPAQSDAPRLASTQSEPRP
jgi:molybdopterin synthase catalytic subunit